MLLPILLLSGAGYWLWKRHQSNQSTVEPPASMPTVVYSPTIDLSGGRLPAPAGGRWILQVIDGVKHTASVIGFYADGNEERSKRVVVGAILLATNRTPNASIQDVLNAIDKDPIGAKKFSDAFPYTVSYDPTVVTPQP
jgi:hypothetical protein